MLSLLSPLTKPQTLFLSILWTVTIYLIEKCKLFSLQNIFFFPFTRCPCLKLFLAPTERNFGVHHCSYWIVFGTIGPLSCLLWTQFFMRRHIEMWRFISLGRKFVQELSTVALVLLWAFYPCFHKNVPSCWGLPCQSWAWFIYALPLKGRVGNLILLYIYISWHRQ